MEPTEQVLEVWGDLACFTRPELKVERFSYPVITPSAARGIFDAIYSKPNRDPTQAQFRWQVTRVDILNEPRYIALRRNEVKEKISVANVQKWMAGKAPPQPILADADSVITGSDAKGRTQRQTLALRDVRYRLHAWIVPWPGYEDQQKAFEEQFKRRAKHGKCFYQPYFGCREFPAYFEWCEPGSPLPADRWKGDLDIGLMLYDVFDLSSPGTPNSASRVSLFRAQVCGGVLIVPPPDSPDVLQPGGGEAQ